MKRRNMERVERRKARVDLNLVEQGGPRGRKPATTRGCASMLGRILMLLAFVSAVSLGLR